jgi:hypothetical protein
MFRTALTLDKPLIICIIIAYCEIIVSLHEKLVLYYGILTRRNNYNLNSLACQPILKQYKTETAGTVKYFTLKTNIPNKVKENRKA